MNQADPTWQIRWTTRSDGNFALSSDGISERRSAVVGDLPVVWLRQTHGTNVVVVASIEQADSAQGVSADAAVTTVGGVALCVITADCAPLALTAGSVGAVVHAGWQGLAAGVIEATVAAIRAIVGPDEPIVGQLGPCIHPGSYAFGPDDLRLLIDRYGHGVEGTTADGAPALNLPAGITAACEGVGVAVSTEFCQDTSGPDYFSHRVRQDRQRQALFLWRP
jgi:polyphenol oxidase